MSSVCLCMWWIAPSMATPLLPQKIGQIRAVPHSSTLDCAARCIQSGHVIWCERAHALSPGWWRSVSVWQVFLCYVHPRDFCAAEPCFIIASVQRCKRQGWGLVAGGGWMAIIHGWPRSASNQSYTHLSHGISHKNHWYLRETYDYHNL